MVGGGGGVYVPIVAQSGYELGRHWQNPVPVTFTGLDPEPLRVEVAIGQTQIGDLTGPQASVSQQVKPGAVKAVYWAVSLSFTLNNLFEILKLGWGQVTGQMLARRWGFDQQNSPIRDLFIVQQFTPEAAKAFQISLNALRLEACFQAGIDISHQVSPLQLLKRGPLAVSD